MPDPKTDRVNAERPRGTDPFDALTGFTGEDYDRDREAALGAKRPSGGEDVVATGEDPAYPGGRAHFDPRTGEVHEQGLPEGETGSEPGAT